MKKLFYDELNGLEFTEYIIAISEDEAWLRSHLPTNFIEYDSGYIDPKAKPYFDDETNIKDFDVSYCIFLIKETNIKIK